MENEVQAWTCGSCGRANETVVALDGHARCVICATKTRIRASRDYLSVLSARHPELPGDSESEEDGLPIW